MKVAVFIEHNITYRHFILSRAFAELAACHELVVVVPEPHPYNKRFDVPLDRCAAGLDVQAICVNFERLYQWRRLFQVLQLQWRPGRNWRNIRKVMRRNVGRRAFLVSKLLGLPVVFPVFRLWTMRQICRHPSDIEEFVDRFEPDVMIHPTVLEGFFINDFVQVGKSRSIPTIAIMNSWDNPGTKRAVVGQPDWLLVWGEQTRQLAIDYVGMPPERTVSFGAAQFDLYRAPPRVTRDEFCRAHGIASSKKILLYAGASKGSDEYAHLSSIEEAIANGELGELVVVYRPHPWGGGGKAGQRLLERQWKHVRIERSMRKYLEEAITGGKPNFLADYADTHDVLSSVDLVVSPLSTILIEAALHLKPIICFLPDEEESESLRMQSRFLHFQALFQSPMADLAVGNGSLISSLKDALHRVGNPEHEDTLRRETAYFVEPFQRSFGTRLREFVEAVSSNAPIDGSCGTHEVRTPGTLAVNLRLLKASRRAGGR